MLEFPTTIQNATNRYKKMPFKCTRYFVLLSAMQTMGNVLVNGGQSPFISTVNEETVYAISRR